MSQHLLDQELLVHQNRLIQLLDQGDNEIFADQETPILTADLSGKIYQQFSELNYWKTEVVLPLLVNV